MHRRTPVACAAAVLIVSSAAMAQEQRVEITGSAIKRVNAETPAPVEIVTREQIARIGATSVNELLKSLAVVDIFDTGEISSNSPGGSGTARVRLRGLGDTQTLVLINGRRVPVNPLQDTGGAGAAFDVNQLPVSAIDRVEILKDGGSALYGADAVAGVVNFILRRNYQGVSLKGTAGTSSRSDGDEKQVSLTAGWGDLATQRFNVLAALDVFKRDPILRKDRDISRTSDYRRFGPVPNVANLDGRSSFAPQGNILNANGAATGQTVQPCPPENFSNGACRYDFNASLLTAYNAADRISALVTGSVQVTPDIVAFARAMGSRNEDHFEAHPVPDNFVLPDGRRYAGRFLQGGPRTTDRKTDFLNLELGAEGTFKGLDWKAGLSRGKAETTNRDSNYFDRTAYNLATQGDASRGIAPTINPTVTTNSEAAIQALRIYPVRRGEATLDLFDTQLAGEAFKLPGGPMRWAVGLNAWKENLTDQPDPLQVAGQVVGSIQQSAVAADRDAKAIYAELQLPLLKTLEGQLSLRHDRYDTASRSSPKVGLKWDVAGGFALRASYSESFKMPTLKQLFANAGQGAINLTEEQCRGIGLPAGCAGLAAFRLTGSNPQLGPEVGKTYNYGAIFETGPFSASVDWWQVKKSDNITTPTLDQAIQQGAFRFDTPTARWFIFQNLQNFASSENEGIDLDLQFRQRGTPLGNLTVRGTMTYYKKQRTKILATDPWDEFNGTYATPRWRSALTVTSEVGPWTLTGIVRGWAGFYDSVQPLRSLPAGTRRVDGYDEFDLGVSWAGLKNVKFSGAIKNLFDRMPPFSATNATNNNYSQQGFAELYTSRGRYVQVSAEVLF
ncbi:MAG: TonB-dependent receptor [Rubrivivax sp.]|nr:TonB-dependent receptor [Rubrivivax sp.]